MNKLLKKMMVALLVFGIGQTVYAEEVPDVQKILWVAEQGYVPAQYILGVM